MLRSFLLLLLLIGAPPFAEGNDTSPYETVLTKRVDGEITIDAEGKVLAHAFRTEMEPEIRALLDKAVATWKFHPYMVGGVAVKARSKMRVTVVARQQAGGFKVSIDNVNFSGDAAGDASGGGTTGSSAPRTDVVIRIVRRPATIQYPKYAVNGMSVIAVRLGRNGKVEEAIATQTTFFNATGSADEFDRARQQMEANALAGIRRWTFAVRVPDGAEPRPEDLTGIITVNYVTPGTPMPAARTPGKWRQETRAVNRSIPWIDDRRLAQSVRASDLDAGSAMLDFDSGFRLREGEAGMVL